MSPEFKRGRVPPAGSGGDYDDNYVALRRAPAGVKPLEVRCAHPVRLSPDTHSQGHGRPCLQRLHPRRGFSATWSLLMIISMLCNSLCALKRFPRTSSFKNVVSCVKQAFSRTRKAYEGSLTRPGGKQLLARPRIPPCFGGCGGSIATDMS